MISTDGDDVIDTIYKEHMDRTRENNYHLLCGTGASTQQNLLSDILTFYPFITHFPFNHALMFKSILVQQRLSPPIKLCFGVIINMTWLAPYKQTTYVLFLLLINQSKTTSPSINRMEKKKEKKYETKIKPLDGRFYDAFRYARSYHAPACQQLREAGVLFALSIRCATEQRKKGRHKQICC